jgi:hypothetical protein
LRRLRWVIGFNARLQKFRVAAFLFSIGRNLSGYTCNGLKGWNNLQAQVTRRLTVTGLNVIANRNIALKIPIVLSALGVYYNLHLPRY